MSQWIFAIGSLVFLPVLNADGISGCSQFTYCWSLSWRILSITLLACEMRAIVQLFEHSMALPFFGIGMKTDLFHSCGDCSVFQGAAQVLVSASEGWRELSHIYWVPCILGSTAFQGSVPHLHSHQILSAPVWAPDFISSCSLVPFDCSNSLH